MASTIAISTAAVRIAPITKVNAASTKARTAFVSNGTVKKTTAMLVWTPINNKFFETFSFLPPLSDSEITKQVDYIVRNGWTPCLEFSDPEGAYIGDTNTVRLQGTSAGYQDNRYWSMWKLPMFGCTDGSQVLKEIAGCTKAFPGAYIRLVAFDNQKQVQCTGFLVHRPVGAKEFQPADKRSV
uniref:Ribulose bisphosphate carboxylase small subunit, chloroplastic n=1 Tax=Nannochloris bacillaris TaxID=76111 RepID=Q68BL0_NANBA|nr:ribulose-1,5-bisphosphate carboxyase/oxygenase small subunit [Nannochloris bacillaris]